MKRYNVGEHIIIKNKKTLKEKSIIVFHHSNEDGYIVDNKKNKFDLNEEYEIVGGLICG